MSLVTTFEVIERFENSPDRIDEAKCVETPDRVDLRQLPAGSVVQFYGVHNDSKYICLITGNGEERRIKVWLKGRGNGAVGTIDNVISNELTDPDSLERGVMQIGKCYFMPYFLYDKDDNLTLDYEQGRIEGYTEIFVLQPND